MRICIYYFSGTGNTRFIAEKLRDDFISRSETCEAVPLEELTLGRAEFNPGSYDLIGIGFPVHAFAAPRILEQFLELLPPSRQDYFLFKTAGSKFLLGGSTYAIRLHLAKKGWKLKYEAFFEMPSNVFTKEDSSQITERVRKARVRVQEVGEEISRGIKKVLPSTGLMRTANLFHCFENAGCKHGSANWWADEKCTKCGLCVRQCPTANIRLENGKLVFSDHCIFCLRCRWNCPVQALHHRHLEPFLLKKPYTLPD